MLDCPFFVYYVCVFHRSDGGTHMYSTSQVVSEFSNGGWRMVPKVRKVPRMVHDVQRHRGYKQHAE